MDILIIGGGGREHALAEAYVKSKNVKRVFVAPGNGLMDFKNEKISILPSVRVLDFDAIVSVVKEREIDLVDVAQDDSLAAGFVDRLKMFGIQAFGPTQKAAEIEWSKEWARNFMVKYGLPIPRFKAFSNKQQAIRYIDTLSEQTLYVKASGLAAGKGAIRTENKNEAIEAIETMQQFGKSGETFLIEDDLVGEEFSLFIICDGKNYVIVGFAQDHKTVYNSDHGPNTGGMGCVAPTSVASAKVIREVKSEILIPFMRGMEEEGRPYSGILYLGGMLTNPPAGGDVKVLEFNARWGDPEAEVILPSIKTDYLEVVQAVINKTLNKLKIDLDNKVRLSVAGCSLGYPNDCSAVKGKEIFGVKEAMKMSGITIFGAGIKREGKRFFVNGGRVFHLVAEGKDILTAREKAYKIMKLISIEGNNLHYRTDIGWRDVERFRNKKR